jgi:methionine sulfoxide reductase heme-binding subunit
VVVGLHLAAGLREWRRDARVAAEVGAGWVDICAADDVPDGRARAAAIGGERVAVYRYGDRVSCVSAVCRHQNGPLAEGRIIDGCITCPWHGYQYYPDSGASPPPFQDKIATYRVRVRDGRVEVHQTPNPPGTPVPPASIR